MTQQQIEQTRVIAEKDGFHLSATTLRGDLYAKGGDSYFDFQFPYLTDLNTLHRVAMDVMEELQKVRTEHRQFYIGEIRYDMFSRPINGQYIDLFNAVYDGIIFLNNSKTPPKEAVNK